MQSFLKRLNDAAKTNEKVVRDEALEPFLTDAIFRPGREVNVFSVIDMIPIAFFFFTYRERMLPWCELKNSLYTPYNNAINNGVNGKASQAIVRAFGHRVLAWMRKYNRESRWTTHERRKERYG